MTLDSCIDFANQNPACWLATVDEGSPRVRGMLLWFADETGFTFHTASIKSLAHQLRATPKAEAAFHQMIGPMQSRMLRVSGEVTFLDEPALEAKLYEERPWVLDNKRQMPETDVLIFRISRGTCRFWELSNNGRERDTPRIAFPPEG